MPGPINLSSPINQNHPLNRGLVSCHGMIPYSFTRGRIRDQFNRNNMTADSGCSLSMTGPIERSIKFSTGTLTVPSTVFTRINGNGKISLGLWIKPSAFGTYKSIYDTTNRHASFFINAATDIYTGFGGTAGGITSTISFTTDEWQYLMVCYDGFNVAVYRNGRLAGTRTLGNTVFTDSLVFGTNPSGGGSNFQGWQAGWRIWSRSFNANQAYALYKQAKIGFRDMYNYLAPRQVDYNPPAFTLTCDYGDYTLGGQDATLTYNVFGITADYGAFSLGGQDATLTYSTITADYGPFALSGQDATLTYTPVVNSSITADYGSYMLNGVSITLVPPSSVYSDDMTSSYLGRYRRGQELSLLVTPSDLPTACPIVDYWLEGTTKVLAVQLPLVKGDGFIAGSLFAFQQYLGNAFLDGHYIATVRYIVGYQTTVHYRYFEVIGGSGAGHVINLHELRRPLGRAVVTHSQDGSVKIGYNPRVE